MVSMGNWNTFPPEDLDIRHYFLWTEFIFTADYIYTTQWSVKQRNYFSQNQMETL